ncbi:MAG: acyl carrier protein [Rhodospirillales bacterium]
MRDPEQIAQLLREHVAALLDMEPGEIDPRHNLAEYGLDSADAVLLAGALEDILDTEIDAAIVLRNRTIDGVLADLQAAGLIDA